MPLPPHNRTTVTKPAGAGTARTVSGSSEVLLGHGGARFLRCQLDVTAASGTTPNLVVTIEDTIDGVNFYTIGTFAAKTTTGREVINITTPFADTLRVSWAISGTTPSFTFATSIYAAAA